MKITKYPQSCLLIEKDTSRILIDPGTNATDLYDFSTFGRLDGVLYTHSHTDHLDPVFAKEALAHNVPILGNSDVLSHINDSRASLVNASQRLKLAEFKIFAHDLPHCLLIDGSEAVQNTSYFIDERLLLPGDSTAHHQVNLSLASIIALPIIGPDISFYDAAQMALKYRAEHIIPVHSDNVGINPEVFARSVAKYELPFIVHSLQNGQSIEL